MTEDEIATQIVDAAYKVQTELGPGLLESVLRSGYGRRTDPPRVASIRADLIVGGKVIIEIKSVEAIAPVHRQQLLTYLRLAGKRLGLLFNFDTELIKNGIARVVNSLPE
jgi:hypothetical protein